MKIKKLISLALAAAMITAMTACQTSQQPAAETPPVAETPAATPETPAEAPAETPAQEPAPQESFKVAMITDTGGVNDESFNQSAWEGLQKAESQYGMKVKFVESHQEADYPSNIDRMVDEEQDLIWGIGFMMSDAILNAAQQNPDRLFAIVDSAYAPEDGANLIGVVFQAQDPSFEVGYMAGLTTTSDKVGFIGGMKSDIIDQFEYGYRGGVAYAAKELGKTISVEVQYVESWTDDAKAKAIASQMYTNGADIIFAAAGNAGKGMFEAAKEYDKLAIGVDRDQSDLAPEHTLTSAMKLVGNAMCDVSKAIMDGKGLELGGTTQVFGLSEGGVGIPEKSLATPEVYQKTKAVESEIAAGKIVAPYNEETLTAFEASL